MLSQTNRLVHVLHVLTIVHLSPHFPFTTYGLMRFFGCLSLYLRFNINVITSWKNDAHCSNELCSLFEMGNVCVCGF